MRDLSLGPADDARLLAVIARDTAPNMPRMIEAAV
jgi:hypothetical protein